MIENKSNHETTRNRVVSDDEVDCILTINNPDGTIETQSSNQKGRILEHKKSFNNGDFLTINPIADSRYNVYDDIKDNDAVVTTSVDLRKKINSVDPDTMAIVRRIDAERQRREDTQKREQLLYKINNSDIEKEDALPTPDSSELSELSQRIQVLEKELESARQEMGNLSVAQQEAVNNIAVICAKMDMQNIGTMSTNANYNKASSASVVKDSWLDTKIASARSYVNHLLGKNNKEQESNVKKGDGGAEIRGVNRSSSPEEKKAAVLELFEKASGGSMIGKINIGLYVEASKQGEFVDEILSDSKYHEVIINNFHQFSGITTEDRREITERILASDPNDKTLRAILRNFDGCAIKADEHMEVLRGILSKNVSQGVFDVILKNIESYKLNDTQYLELLDLMLFEDMDDQEMGKLLRSLQVSFTGIDDNSFMKVLDIILAKNPSMAAIQRIFEGIGGGARRNEEEYLDQVAEKVTDYLIHKDLRIVFKNFIKNNHNPYCYTLNSLVKEKLEKTLNTPQNNN